MWDELEITANVIEILQEVHDNADDHHYGHPFMTAYQLAIEYVSRHPDVLVVLNLPFGGAGTGQHNAFTRYLAQGLSQRILHEQITQIEGRFLSNRFIENFSFNRNGEIVHSSFEDDNQSMSIFRLANPDE
jgi:hypothetical protein